MTKEYGLSGIGSSVQFGKAGPLIVNTGGEFSARDTADSTYVNFSVATPTQDQHAATKFYVDSFITGLDFKQSVDFATVAPLSASTYDNGTSGFGASLTKNTSGALIIDGVSPTVGQRILVKDQVDQTENGIYIVTDAGSGGSPFILTRSSDADNSPANEVSGGMFCFITGGNTLLDTGWVLSAPNGSATLGSDNLVFTQFSSAGVITVSAGSALDKSGNALSIRVDGSTIGINSTGNGQLVVRSTGTANQTLLSSGVSGNAASWGFIEDLKGASTGRFIIDGVDAGGSNTNYLQVTTSNGTSAPKVTIQAINANGTADASNIDLVIQGKGTGVIAVGSTISTLSNADLVLDPNGTGLIAVGSAISTLNDANLVLDPNGTGIIELQSNIDVFSNTIKTSTTNGDIKFLPNGTGVLSVAGTTNYELNVTNDDDIPNKKYIDDAITGATPASVARDVITADGANSSFNVGSTLPNIAGKNTYVTRVSLNVSSIFSGGSVSQAKVTDGTNILMSFTENDVTVSETYIAELPLAVTSTGSQIDIQFYQNDGTTPAIPTSGSAIAVAFFTVL